MELGHKDTVVVSLLPALTGGDDKQHLTKALLWGHYYQGLSYSVYGHQHTCLAFQTPTSQHTRAPFSATVSVIASVTPFGCHWSLRSFTLWGKFSKGT